MGNSISTQFLQMVQDRLLASIEIPSKHFKGESYDTRPPNVSSMHTFVRSYATSCAMRLAYVVVMTASKRRRDTISTDDIIIDKIAEELHEIWRSNYRRDNGGRDVPAKKIKDEKGNDQNVDINVPWRKLVDEYKKENKEAAKAALDAVRKHKDDHQASIEVHNKWRDRRIAEGEGGSWAYGRDGSGPDLMLEFDKLSQTENDTVQVTIARKYIEKPYVWDTSSDCVILSADTSKEEQAEYVKELTETLSEKRISIEELWEAEGVLSNTIQMMFLRTWERVKDIPSIKRRFRPRSFLNELVRQIAIIEIEATLCVINEDAFSFNPESDILLKQPSMYSIVKDRISEFKQLVPHLRSVALMDAAMRQSLITSRILIKSEQHVTNAAFDSITFSKNPERNFISSIYSSIPNENQKPFDMKTNMIMLSGALYDAFENLNTSLVCRGTEHAHQLAERLLLKMKKPDDVKLEDVEGAKDVEAARAV